MTTTLILFNLFKLSAPERSEGAEVLKKHVRDADDHVGAICEIRVVALHRSRLSVCLSVRPLLTELVRAP